MSVLCIRVVHSTFLAHCQSKLLSRNCFSLFNPFDSTSFPTCCRVEWGHYSQVNLQMHEDDTDCSRHG